MSLAYKAYKPTAYEQLTVSSTAVGLTSSKYKPATGRPANIAIIRVAGGNVRYRQDGVDPTASVGVPVNVGEILTLDGDLASYKFIRQTVDATLDIEYGLAII